MSPDRRRDALLGAGLLAALAGIVGPVLLALLPGTGRPGAGPAAYALVVAVPLLLAVLAVGLAVRRRATGGDRAPGRGAPVAGEADDGPVRPTARPARGAPRPVDDPDRDRELGEVLVALRDGPASRDALRRRVGADGWGPGRFAAAVDHGLAAGVLREDAGTLRARFDD